MNRNAAFSVFLAIGLSTFFWQCKKDKNQLGLSVYPQSDQIGLIVSDTSSIITYTVTSDSIATDEISAAMVLGSYLDPYFGKVEASIYTQIRLAGSVDFTPVGGSLSDLVIDSAVLYMALEDTYGNLDAQTIEVYQLTENLYIDSIYYSNRNLSHTSSNLVKAGEGSIIPNPNSPGFVNGNFLNVSLLRIPLNVNDFAMPIINQSGTTALNGNDGTGFFVDWFKGLYITTNNVGQTQNQGAMLYLDPLHASSKITIYYRDNSGLPADYDTIQFDFNINASCARFTNFKQDYTGTPVASQLLDSTQGMEEFFLQTMGGVRSKIAFPNLRHLLDSSNVVINKAELVLPIQYYSGDVYTPASELFLVRTLDDGSISFIPDYSEDRGGTYVASTNSYTFNVTSYLNQMLAGKFENLPLTIISSGNAVTANRLVFNGPNTILKDKPKLIITYSKYE